jgi:GNAT superfamily N-acetyltransferase
MSLNIYRAQSPTDRRALETLLARLMREHQTRYPDTYPRVQPDDAAARIAAGYAPRLGNDLRLVAVLAADRAPVGCLVGEVVARAVGQPATSCFVEWFFVEPEERGQGIGRALVRAGLRCLAAQGVTHIECQSVPGDRQWARRGWLETARRYVAPFADVARWVDLEEHAS